MQVPRYSSIAVSNVSSILRESPALFFHFWTFFRLCFVLFLILYPPPHPTPIHWQHNLARVNKITLRHIHVKTESGSKGSDLQCH